MLLVFFGLFSIVINADETINRDELVNTFIRKNLNQLKKSNYTGVSILQSVLNTTNITTVPPDVLTDEDDADSGLVLADSTIVSCASGWTQYSGNGLCYKTSDDTTWDAANAYCLSQNAQLASVHSQAQAEWLATTFATSIFLLGTYEDLWIGLKRSCDNSTWVWTDGSAFDYIWWQSAQPEDVDPNERCVTIWQEPLLLLDSSYTPGQFDNIFDCDEDTATPLCQYDPSATVTVVPFDCTTTTTTITSTTTTPTSTTTTPTTTTTTPTTTTTTPTTTSTTPTTTTTTPTTTTSTTSTTTTSPTTTTTTPITTTTMKPTVITTTTPGVPSTTTTVLKTTTATLTTTKKATSTSTTKTTTQTTTTTPLTTTKVTTTTKTTTTASSSICTQNCDSGWVAYNSSCYAVIQGRATYDQAVIGCQSFGADIATIQDSDQNDALRKAFSTNDNSFSSDQAWIGNSSYHNWAYGKPDMSFGSEYTYCNSFALSVVNSGYDWGYVRGVWNDYPCEKTQLFAICVK